MKTFNEIMKIRDEPDNKPEVTKRKFQVKKTNNEKMQAFGWASVAIAENGETLEDWQGDIIEPDELESAAYKFVDLYREGGEMHERGGVAYLIESVVFTEDGGNGNPGRYTPCWLVDWIPAYRCGCLGESKRWNLQHVLH